MKKVSLLSIAICALGLGCGDKGGAASSASASADAKAKPSGSTAATSTAATTASAAPAGSASTASSVTPAAGGDFASFKDLDLSGFHKIWKGYSVKAPEGAVIKKGYGGPRIEKDKEFAIELSFSDTRLENTAESTKECVNYDQFCMVVDRGKDFVITSARGKTEPNEKATYAFHMLIHPGGNLMACKGGADKREKLAILQKACESVTKQ